MASMIFPTRVFQHLLILALLYSLVGMTNWAFAATKEAPKVATRVIVVFHNQTLPADAAKRVEQAGGKVVSFLSSVGILVASPVSVDGARLIQSLRKDTAVLDAVYDRVFDLIAPVHFANDQSATTSPETHFPHPLPTFSPALPPDFFYTSSPQQWSVKRVGAQGGGVPGGGSGAWDLTMGAGARIAILDTGVNPVHPDVSGNLIFNRALTSDDPGIFGTPNCEVLDVTNPPFDLPADQNGHGTWTASLAAGAIGGGLMIGVAPQASVLNIKVLRNTPAAPEDLAALGVSDTPFNRCRFRNGSGLFSWVLQGMLLANQQGADVISMSLGGFVPRNFPGGEGAAIWSAFNRVADFVTANGSLVVAAAGNSALDLNRIGPFVFLPADASNIIAVTATTNPALPPPGCPAGTDCLASYSDFGTSLHGLASPGGDLPPGGCAFSGTPCNPTGFLRGACSSGVPGTINPDAAGYPASGPPPAGTSWGCFSFAGDAQHAWYVQAIGTSGSTPLVAGAAALVKATNSRISPAQIRTILQRTAQDIGKVGYDRFFNFGLVDAASAVKAANE